MRKDIFERIKLMQKGAIVKKAAVTVLSALILLFIIGSCATTSGETNSLPNVLDIQEKNNDLVKLEGVLEQLNLSKQEEILPAGFYDNDKSFEKNFQKYYTKV